MNCRAAALHNNIIIIIQIEVQEVDRLAAVVCTIQQESAAVPKGAYMLTQTGAIVRNNSFHGLSQAEAGLLSYYLHFSPDTNTSAGNVCS